MQKRPIIIWGAGRIGRGFVAEAFSAPDHQLILVDIVKPLIDQLNARGRYTIFHADASGIRESEISGYLAFETSDAQALMPHFMHHQPIVSVAVFAHQVQAVAEMLAPYVRLRAKERPNDPMDITLSINMIHPDRAFRQALQSALSGDEVSLNYMNERMGIVSTVVMCIAPYAPQQCLARDPLAIYNNNFPQLIVGQAGLRGQIPEGLGMLRLSPNIEAEEMRKIYSLNMAHATASYLGMGLGYACIKDAVCDPTFRPLIESALAESAVGLSGEFGFTQAEMQDWNHMILGLLENPHIGDDLVRLGADARRKLGPNDRLVGAARLSIRHGGTPTTIARAIRRGFLYEHEDEGTRWVQQMIKAEGLEAAMRKVSGLAPDEPLYDMVRNAKD